MKKNILIPIITVIVVLSVLGTACFCAFITNRNTINAEVDKLLDARISEYMAANGDKYQGQQGNPGMPGAPGANGADGQNGTDGQTPYIGENNNWWIGEEDTGCLASGTNGMSAYDVAVENGFTGTQEEWMESLHGVNGQDGQTPFIGKNGNWWIGDTDTGVKAGAETTEPQKIYKHTITITGNNYSVTGSFINTVSTRYTISNIPNGLSKYFGLCFQTYDISKMLHVIGYVGEIKEDGSVYYNYNVIGLCVLSSTGYLGIYYARSDGSGATVLNSSYSDAFSDSVVEL